MAAIDTTRTAFAAPAVANRSGTFLSRLMGTFSAWNDARLTRKALHALSDRELDDIGLARNEIDAIAARRG